MCTCQVQSKQVAGPHGDYNYVLTCTQDDGTKKEIKLSASSDKRAIALAEIECAEDKTH